MSLDTASQEEGYDLTAINSWFRRSKLFRENVCCRRPTFPVGLPYKNLRSIQRSLHSETRGKALGTNNLEGEKLFQFLIKNACGHFEFADAEILREFCQIQLKTVSDTFADIPEG